MGKNLTWGVFGRFFFSFSVSAFFCFDRVNKVFGFGDKTKILLDPYKTWILTNVIMFVHYKYR